MDREEHGEGSSSPSDNPVLILSVQERGTGGARCRVRLDDGSSFFCSTNLVSSFGLHEGMRLDSDLRARFFSALDQERAIAKAVELLARREHSREELKVKLLSRSFTPLQVRNALDVLSSRGYLDTSRFAEEWVRTRLARHPEGRSMLFAGLLSHGVPRADAEDILDRMLSAEVLDEAALAAASRYARKQGMTEIKLKKRLFSLGFDRRTTMKVIERMKGIM